MGRYIDREDVKAEEMFERLLGYSFAVTTYEEEHSFRKGFGYQIKLSREPIEIESCQGFLEYELMRVKDWHDIPLNTIIHNGGVLDIPPSIFGVPFKKVKIRYTSGEVEIPQEIKEVVTEISDHLAKHTLNLWNIPLSHKALTTINKYKERGER